MHIYLFNNKAENNRVDKSNYLEHIVSVEGTLRNSTSVITPSIILDERAIAINPVYAIGSRVFTSDNVPVGYANNLSYTDILRANYMYIPEFNRYYFINDVVSINQGLWEIASTCDVLYSYKDNLLGLSAYIERNEYRYNMNIPDNLISFENDYDIKTFVIPMSKTLTYKAPKKPMIVVTIYDENILPSEPENSFPSTNTGILDSVNSYNIGYGSNTISYILDCSLDTETEGGIVELNNLLSSVIDNENIGTGIFNITAYPFDPDDFPKGSVETIEKINGETLEYPFQAYPLTNQAPIYYKVADFHIPFKHIDEWLNRKPYTEYKLYIPYANTIDLDYDMVKDTELHLYYIPNYLNGTTSYMLLDNTRKIISQGETTLGISIPINSSNNQQVRDNIASSATSMGVSALTGATMLAAGAALAGGPVGVIGVGMILGGTSSIVSGVANNAVAISNQHSKLDLKTPSGISGAYSSQKLILYVSSNIPTINTFDAGYRKLVGKPLKEIYQLSNLSGFTTMSGFHLENIPATKQEKEQIETLFNAGVIL